MKRTLTEHLLSVALVAGLFVGAMVYFRSDDGTQPLAAADPVQQYLQLPFVDFGDPLDRALFKETLDVFYPASRDQNARILESIDDVRREQFTNELYKTGGEQRGITKAKLGRIVWMFAQFIIIYVIVMGLSYYGAETMGVYRFIRKKQGRVSYLEELFDTLRHGGGNAARFARAASALAKMVAAGVISLILFSPAYVIAYSFKTRFDTDSNLFMILLGVLSNGVLITYANRFFTFLVAESRRGYVETAIVKNLNNSYERHAPDGLPLRAILRWTKRFPGHVFQHIYINAHHQYVPALKEQASFVITGLVIIEMALNIQGHLSYEMLKNILYKQYDVVALILFLIFLLIKGTEVAADLILARKARIYENRSDD